MQLDVTNPQGAARAAEHCADVTLLINNAGIARGSSLMAEAAINATGAEFETNMMGPLHMSRAFAPVLARSGAGAIISPRC